MDVMVILPFTQWRNDAPAAPATPGGAVLRGRQIVIKNVGQFCKINCATSKITRFV